MTTKELKDKLDIILSTLQVHTNNLHAYHWSVTAPDFISLHQYIDSIYNATGAHVDAIAEFSRIYDMHPVNTLAEYVKKSLIKEITFEQSTDRAKGLDKIIADTTVLITISKDLFNKTDDDFPDVNDYAAVMFADFGKRKWFLKAIKK